MSRTCCVCASHVCQNILHSHAAEYVFQGDIGAAMIQPMHAIKVPACNEHNTASVLQSDASRYGSCMVNTDEGNGHSGEIARLLLPRVQ